MFAAAWFHLRRPSSGSPSLSLPPKGKAKGEALRTSLASLK